MLIPLIAAFVFASVPPAEDAHPLRSLRVDAQNLREIFESTQAHAMLDEVERLPVLEPTTVFGAWRPTRGYTESQYSALDEDQREGLREIPIAPEDYYSTFYGTPLVYARVLDLLNTFAPEFSIDHSRIMDLGYGQLGQLRLWAQMGADVTGVEVDPILTAIYTDCNALGDLDQDPSTPGSITLIEGSWPNEESTRKEIGDGYDLLISRNLLKQGYVKPAQLNPNFPPPVGWGMTDAQMLGHVYDLLNPGGIVVIESLGPKPDPAKPWSDISNPWPQQAWIDAGFEVLAYDTDESAYARSMGDAIGWGEKMDLENDLFGVYSVFQRPTKPESGDASLDSN